MNPKKTISDLPSGYRISIMQDLPFSEGLNRATRECDVDCAEIWIKSSNRNPYFGRITISANFNKTLSTHSSAAEGWGPLLYEIAMEFCTMQGFWLRSGINGVTEEAMAVWDKFLKRASSGNEISIRRSQVYGPLTHYGSGQSKYGPKRDIPPFTGPLSELSIPYYLSIFSENVNRESLKYEYQKVPELIYSDMVFIDGSRVGSVKPMKSNPQVGYHPDLFSKEDTRVFIPVDTLTVEDVMDMTPADFSKSEYLRLQRYPELAGIVKENEDLISASVLKRANIQTESLTKELRSQAAIKRSFLSWLKTTDCIEDWPPTPLRRSAFPSEAAYFNAIELAKDPRYWNFSHSNTYRGADFFTSQADIDRKDRFFVVDADLSNVEKSTREQICDAIYDTVSYVEEVIFEEGIGFIVTIKPDGYQIGILDIEKLVAESGSRPSILKIMASSSGAYVPSNPW